LSGVTLLKAEGRVLREAMAERVTSAALRWGIQVGDDCRATLAMTFQQIQSRASPNQSPVSSDQSFNAAVPAS
jgi:hypothetical protein